MSIFSDIKDFINNIHDGDFVLRRDLIRIIKGTSIDSYRRTLTLAGYLEDIGKPGVYKKIKNIPDSLTTTQAIFDAYNKGFPFKNKIFKFKNKL